MLPAKPLATYKLTCDSVKIRAPLSDRSGQITFTVGEYQLDALLDVFKQFKDKVFTILVQDKQ